MRHQFIAGDIGIVDQRIQCARDLGKIVGRDVGGHAHGDPRGSVDEQARQPGRQHGRLGERFVVVGRVVDGLLLQVRQHLMGDLGHSDFRVPHGGGAVAVDGAEVALAVHEGVAEGEILGHAHDGIVDGRVPVGMIFTDDVTDDAGGFLVGFVPVVFQLVHGEQHAPVDRLEAVPHIRQRPADDHAHGIVQIGLLHLGFDADFGHISSEFHINPCVLLKRSRGRR